MRYVTRDAYAAPARVINAKKRRYAKAVPGTPSATTDPISFQPGVECGAWTIPAGKGDDGGDGRRREPDDDRRHRCEVAAGEEPADRVTERHPDDGERAEHLPRRLRPDEERDADEADRDADEPRPGHPYLAEEAERDDRDEDRDRRLEDRGEGRVIRVSPHDRSQKGAAVSTSATITSQSAFRAQGRQRPPRADREGAMSRERHCGEA